LQLIVTFRAWLNGTDDRGFNNWINEEEWADCSFYKINKKTESILELNNVRNS